MQVFFWALFGRQSTLCKGGLDDCYPKNFGHIFFHVDNQVEYTRAKF